MNLFFPKLLKNVQEKNSSTPSPFYHCLNLFHLIFKHSHDLIAQVPHYMHVSVCAVLGGLGFKGGLMEMVGRAAGEITELYCSNWVKQLIQQCCFKRETYHLSYVAEGCFWKACNSQISWGQCLNSGKKEKKKKTKLLLTGLRRHNCSVKKNTASCDLSAITKSFASKYKTGLDDSSKLKLLVRGLLNYWHAEYLPYFHSCQRCQMMRGKTYLSIP